MTGRITYEPPPEATCKRYGCADMPKADSLKPATIWQCDVCGKEWVVVTGSQYNEDYSAWRTLSDKTRDGYDR